MTQTARSGRVQVRAKRPASAALGAGPPDRGEARPWLPRGYAVAQAHCSLAGGAPWRRQRPRGGGAGGGGLRLVTGDARPQRTGPAAETQDVERRLRRPRRPGAAGSWGAACGL